MGLIDKQVALDALTAQADEMSRWCERYQEQRKGVLTARNIIDDLSPSQQWIPISERLPKVREWVLCQCRAGIMDVLRLTEDGDWNKNYPHAEYMGGFVIAWMPLPAPWKGERDG